MKVQVFQLKTDSDLDEIPLLPLDDPIILRLKLESGEDRLDVAILDYGQGALTFCILYFPDKLFRRVTKALGLGNPPGYWRDGIRIMTAMYRPAQVERLLKDV